MIVETQPDLVKEIRLRIAEVCAACDGEAIDAARAFAEWVKDLDWDESNQPTVHCREDSSGQ